MTATNVIGRRVLARAESWLLLIPVFRTIYAPVKQLVVAFSPDNEYGFKRVVMVEDPSRGWVMGFLTKEFTVDRGRGHGIADGRVRADESLVPRVTSCSIRASGRSFPTSGRGRRFESF